MTGRGMRLVKFVPKPPEVEIKKEVQSEDSAEEEQPEVTCSICSKSFASTLALRNHAMMEHYDAFATGDPRNWTVGEPEDTKPKVIFSPSKKQLKKGEMRQKIIDNTEKVLMSMTKGNLTSLASEDVSYIIIKPSDGIMPTTSYKKKKRTEDAARAAKESQAKRQKEAEAIKGPFECIYEGSCHRIFFSCCEYSIHYRDEHTRRRSGLRCQVCEKPLTATENGQFPYPCDVCGAGFNSNKELSEHTSLVHVKLKPFQCEICHKRFTQQGGVQQHMRMHTGDRPFACSFCQKTFTQKSGLDQHLRIHTKVKPYRCVICLKSFCQSIHLKQHMRTHTHVSPFQCGVCQKRFKQSSHLNYHVRNHDPSVLTPEQREQYDRFLGIINREKVEIEVDQVEVPEVELHEGSEDQSMLEETVEETVEELEEQTVEEQIEQAVAEQSIQVVEEEGEYLLQAGDQTWSVQFVEAE